MNPGREYDTRFPGDPDTDASMRPVLIGLLTILAAVLRIYGLGRDALWIDEYFTWRMVNPGPGHGFWEQLLDNHQNPQYMAMVWPMVRDNFSETLLRLPACVAGIASIPLIARLGQRLQGARTGEWAALLMAISPFHVWYSQEARGYTLAIFWGLCATLILLRMYDREFRHRDAALFGLCAGLSVLGNMSALFLLSAQALTTLWVLRGRPRGERLTLLTALLTAALLVSPWVAKATGVLAFERMLPGAVVGEALRGETTFTMLGWPYTVFTLLYGVSLGPSPAELHWPNRMALIRAEAPLLAVAGIAVLGVLVAGLVSARRRGTLLVWIVVPVLLLTALALRNIKTFTPRYLAVILPYLLAISAVAFSRLRGGFRLAGPLRIAVIVFIALNLVSLGNHHLRSRYAKPDLEGAAAFVAETGRPGEPVLVPVVNRIFALYYPRPEEIVDFDGLAPARNRSAAGEMLAVKLAGLRAGWIVLNSTWVLDPSNYWIELLPDLVDIDLVREFPGTMVYHWTARGDDAQNPVPATESTE